MVESELGAQEGAWFGALVMPRNFGVELMDANLFSRADPPNLALLFSLLFALLFGCGCCNAIGGAGIAAVVVCVAMVAYVVTGGVTPNARSRCS
mgnify:CR=1 FL=1